VLVARATVTKEDALGAVASVWAVATRWEGGGARWAVARGLVKPIKDAAAVVWAMDPAVGHRAVNVAVAAGPPSGGNADRPSVAPFMCYIRGGQCVASGLKQATTVVLQSHTAWRWGTWRGCAWKGWGGGGDIGGRSES